VKPHSYAPCGEIRQIEDCFAVQGPVIVPAKTFLSQLD